MAPSYIGPHQAREIAGVAAGGLWRRLAAPGLAACAAVLVLLSTPGAEAAGGRPRPGWSSAPRWRLPRARAPDCPHGYVKSHGRALTQVQKARCQGPGPERQVAKTSSNRGAPALPGVYDEPGAPASPRSRTPLPGVHDEPGARAPSSRPPPRASQASPRGGRIPTIAPGADATALMRMDRDACHEYLHAREVPFVTVDRARAPEVAIPVRLTGAIAGIEFTIPWSEDEGRDPHAIFDCRLVAALVPVAEFLHAHGVTEVQYFSALRRGKIVRDKPRSQHNVGLAFDLLGLRGPGFPLATVERTYARGRLRGCPDHASAPGPVGAPVPTGASPADLYFALVCQTYTRGLFHTILTPDHDRAHHNHLHLDLKGGQTSPADPFLSVDE